MYMELQLAKLLVGEGLVGIDQIREAVEEQRSSGSGLGDSLVRLGHISETDLLESMGKYFGIPVMDLDSRSIEPEVLKLIPRGTAAEQRLIPVSLVGADLIVAVSDPSNILLLDDLGFITGKHIVPVIASERAITARIAEHYGDSDGREPEGPGKLPRTGKARAVEDIVRELEEFTGKKTTVADGEIADEPDEPDSVTAGEALSGELKSKEGENSAVIDKAVFDLTGSGSGDVSGDFPETKTEPAGRSAVHGLTGESAPRELTFPYKGGSLEEPEGESGASIAEVDGNGAAGNILFEEEVTLSPVPEIPNENFIEGQDVNDTGDQPADGSEDEEATLAETVARPGDETARSAPETRLPKGSVLIVDHSPTIRRVVALALEREGYKVYAAGDGMQALAALNDITPGLILVDINLPHMDGYQLCKVIKGHGLTRDIPVVMMSGKLGMMDKMKGKMAGASDYITKPFAAGDIIGAAEKYLS
ncbi:MAG TPA: response regulator [Thermodesulfobacteriota bacterium]|nr:response regulator [Thermodesulfobacteriota bacterium]